MNELDKFRKIDESNIDVILNEVKEFLQLYLFKGNVSLNDSTIENLFELSHDDLITLKAVHFLLSDKVRELIKSLPLLVRNLSHSTRKETEVMNGNIRGRIDWAETFKERMNLGFEDKSLFVCNPSSKYYDLEENQLLKYILKRIIYLKRNYLEFIEPENFDLDKIDENKDWYTIVNDNFEVSSKILKKVYFNDISDVKIKSKHLRKCIKNRNLCYHKVFDVYQLYESLFISNDEKILYQLLNKRIIKTADVDKLYEIYVFFNLIKSLPVERHKLLFSTNDYSTSCFIDDIKITVHYQKTPNKLKEISEYLEILENYDIKGSTRAPDVILEFEKEGKIYYRLVEVKNSSSTNYIRASIYKVMGYYKDFKRISSIENFDFTEKYPLVLVTWGGISLKKDYNPFNDKIIILNRNEFINSLKQLLYL